MQIGLSMVITKRRSFILKMKLLIISYRFYEGVAVNDGGSGNDESQPSNFAEESQRRNFGEGNATEEEDEHLTFRRGRRRR